MANSCLKRASWSAISALIFDRLAQVVGVGPEEALERRRALRRAVLARVEQRRADRRAHVVALDAVEPASSACTCRRERPGMTVTFSVRRQVRLGRRAGRAPSRSSCPASACTDRRAACRGPRRSPRRSLKKKLEETTPSCCQDRADLADARARAESSPARVRDRSRRTAGTARSGTRRARTADQRQQCAIRRTGRPGFCLRASRHAHGGSVRLGVASPRRRHADPASSRADGRRARVLARAREPAPALAVALREHAW